MAFSGKRGLHVIANVGASPAFTRKRALHVIANVGANATFARKRAIHVVANVYSVASPPTPPPGSGGSSVDLPVGSKDFSIPTGNWSILGVVMDGYTLGVRP